MPNALPKGWYTGLAIGLGLVFVATLPPFVSETARVYVMQAFSAVCHQLPDRSPSVEGVQLAVCHRCYGIYWGLPAAAFAYLALRRRRPGRSKAPWILAASLTPMVLDWGGDVLGVFTNTPSSRMVTGLVFGLVAGYYFVLAMVDAVKRRQ